MEKRSNLYKPPAIPNNYLFAAGCIFTNTNILSGESGCTCHFLKYTSALGACECHAE